MCRILAAFGLCLCLLSAVSAGDPPAFGTVRAPLEGVKVGKVPAALYAHVPKLPAGKGILVLEVASGSSAAQAGLKQYDVLLAFGDKRLESIDSGSGVTLPVSTKTVPVVLFRAGREMTLRIAPVRLIQVTDSSGPISMLKPGGFPTVDVEAKPLQGNRLTVTFTFFPTGSSKLEHVNCSGSVDEIKKRVKDLGQQKRMPQQVQDLADVVLERLRILNDPSAKKE
jgi:hypothetical protein